jgi:hypothetical protein
MINVEMVPLDRVQPAAYNPREADPERLDLLKLSLRKLGFVLPLYALPNGHLLSGHQRLTVAKELGCTRVPVVFVDINEEKLKGINVLFNRRLAVTEPVATPTGWLPIGEIQPGDQVIGIDGLPHTVVSVTDRQMRQMFAVEFDDGTSILADDEHLWTVDYTNKGNTHYVKSGTTSTAELRTMLEERRRVAVPGIQPVVLPEADLPLDPWLLGMLLGDGHISEHGVRLSTSVPEWCVEKVRALLPEGAVAADPQDPTGKCSYIQIRGPKGHRYANLVLNALRAMGLAGSTSATKFVPHAYLWASASQRLALLQGLMDSDGCAGTVTPIYTTVNEGLARAVEHLTHSLGGKASCRVMREANGNWRAAYQVTVRLPQGMCAFTEPAKVAKHTPDIEPRLRRRIVAITPHDVQEAVCISIDTDDHLYLARGFIPTHNCTNDMRSTDTSEKLVKTLPVNELQEMLDAVPDKDPTSPEFYRCVHAEQVPIETLLSNMRRQFETNAVGTCRKLQHAGVLMPAVIDETGEVINGSFRMMAFAEIKPTLQRTGKWPETFPAVRLSMAEARLADLLLNLISMKFTVEKQYADLLRWGAFRRQENKVVDLPQSFRVLVNNFKATSAKDDLDESEKFWQTFRKKYGENIVDFGAGQRRVKPLLTQKGIHCVEFEPYPCDWRGEMGDDHRKDQPHLGLARKVTDEFLADVASKRPYSAVVLSAVLNSVPFHYDRMCVLAVTHALCNFGGVLVGQGRAPENTSSVNYLKNRTDPDGHHLPAPSTFLLDYEPNITLGNVGAAPKVQKAHAPAELKAMLGVFYEEIKIVSNHNYLWFSARHPKRVAPKVLAQAIVHEFNLPWKDGVKLDRHEQALDAYSARMGIDLRRHL